MSVSILERKYQRTKGQPLCLEPKKDGSFIRHKKHEIIEYGFHILCLNCGKIFKTFEIPKKQHITHLFEHQIKIEKTLIDRMQFIYKTSDDQSLALAHKLRIYNRTRDRNLAAEIEALSKLLDQTINIRSSHTRNMPKEKKAAKAAKPKAAKKTTAEKKIKTPVKAKPLTETLQKKQCPKCKKVRSIDKFGKRTYKGRTYYQSRCVDCR